MEKTDSAGLKRRLAMAESKRSVPPAADPVVAEDLLDHASLPESARSRRRDRCARAKVGIRYNGRNYQYQRYRYDRLADAVSYAKLDRARPLEGPLRSEAAPFELLRPPSEGERELMRELGITFHSGVYCLREYRYDRLADAVAYAKLGPVLS